jgi:hypothetical protein
MLNFLIIYQNEISSTNKFQKYRIVLNFYNQPYHMPNPIIHLFIDVLSKFHSVKWKSLYTHARCLAEVLESKIIDFILI